jgi:hypothetical protein
MTTLLAPSAVSTDVDTSEAVHGLAANGFLEALGGIPVRTANARAADHPQVEFNMAQQMNPGIHLRAVRLRRTHN